MLKRVLLYISALTVCVAGIMSCQKDKIQAKVKIVPVESLVIDNEAPTLMPGGTVQLYVTVTPSEASKRPINWNSDDESVASVNSKGLVTAMKVGTAHITAQCDKGLDECTITVVPEPIPVTGVSITPSTTQELGVGKTLQLRATLTPSNATNHNVSWKSSNSSIASVSSSGLVTGRAVGNATITVTTEDGNKTKSVDVNVKQLMTSISVTSPSSSGFDVETRSGNQVFILSKGTTYQISTTISPSNTTDGLNYSLKVNGTVKSSVSGITVSSSGVISTTSQSGDYGTTIEVVVASSSGSCQKSFYIASYDVASSLTFSRGSQCIGTRCTQTIPITLESSSRYYYGTISVSSTGSGIYSAKVSGNNLTVEASGLADSELTTSSSNKKTASVTLKYGPKCAQKTASLSFTLCKLDPFVPKAGDYILQEGSTMKCADGGYRGLGYYETGDGNIWRGSAVAYVAYIGVIHLNNDPSVSTSDFTGLMKFKRSSGDEISIPSDKVHGIAIPTVNAVKRKTSSSLWGGTSSTGKEAYCGSNALLSGASNYPSSGTTKSRLTLADKTSAQHCAYHNTRALVYYNYKCSSSSDIRPIAFCMSPEMLSKMNLSNTGDVDYTTYYYDFYKSGVTGNLQSYSSFQAAFSSNLVQYSRCSPWLIPTVADFFSILSGQAHTGGNGFVYYGSGEAKYQVDALNRSLGSGNYLTGMSYWTSQDYSKDEAWYIDVGETLSNYVHAYNGSKSYQKNILPIFYY